MRKSSRQEQEQSNPFAFSFFSYDYQYFSKPTLPWGCYELNQLIIVRVLLIVRTSFMAGICWSDIGVILLCRTISCRTCRKSTKFCKMMPLAGPVKPGFCQHFFKEVTKMINIEKERDWMEREMTKENEWKRQK